jgi:hypothetical protein
MGMAESRMGDPESRAIRVRAEVRTRRYDSERGCYVYDIGSRTRAPLTDRTVEVSRAVALAVHAAEQAKPPPSMPIAKVTCTMR